MNCSQKLIVVAGLVALSVLCASLGQAGDFKYVIAGDPQFPWACCDVNNRCNEDEDCMRRELRDCPNKLCNDDDSPGDWDDQARKMNRGYVKAMNRLADRYSSLKGVILNGDLTAQGRSDQKEEFKAFYEDKLDLRIWIGLGNHDLITGVTQDDRARMIRYLENRVRKSKRNDDEIRNFDFDYSENNAGTRISGSLAYSYDRGDFHFVQLNFHPAFQRSFEINEGTFDFDEDVSYEIEQSYDWLKADLRSATRRNKRSVICMHDWRDNWGLGGQADFHDALDETNVEAIFVGHIHGGLGLIEYFTNHYSPRERLAGGTSEYDIPVLYSGSPMFGQFLLVDFPESLPIRVREVDITQNTDSTNVSLPSSMPDTNATLPEPAPAYGCNLPRIDAAASLAVGNPNHRDSSMFISETDLAISLGPVLGRPIQCGEELRFYRLESESLWQSGVDAAVGPASTDGARAFGGIKDVGLIKGDSVAFDHAGAPMTMLLAERWPHLPAEFHSDIDAAFRTPDGLVFFFKGTQFVTHEDLDTPALVRGPTPIASFFDVPAIFQNNLDAALVTPNNVVVLVKADAITLTDLSGNKLDPASPESWIPKNLLDRYGVAVTDTTLNVNPCLSPDALREDNSFRATYSTGSQDNPPYAANVGPSECIENFGYDDWLSWTAGFDDQVVIETSLALRTPIGVPMKMGVYRAQDIDRSNCGESPLSLSFAQCMEFDSHVRSTLSFWPVENETYYIRIGSGDRENVQGTIEISRGDPRPPPPTPDTCEGAVRIVGEGGSFDLGSLLSITPTPSTVSEPQDLPEACTDFEEDAWFVWTADRYGLATLRLCPGGEGTLDQVAVYSSSPCSATVEPVACGAGASCETSLDFHVTLGRPYWIRLGAQGALLDGSFSIRIEPDDSFEPNQSRREAAVLPQGASKLLLVDTDWFRFPVPRTPPGELPGRVELRIEEDSGAELQLSNGIGLVLDTWTSEDSGWPAVSYINPLGASQKMLFARVRATDETAAVRPYLLELIVQGNLEDDNFEDNDSCETATTIKTGVYRDLKLRENDPDWFKLLVPEQGRVDGAVSFEPMDGEIGATLYQNRVDDDNCPGSRLWAGQIFSYDEDDSDLKSREHYLHFEGQPRQGLEELDYEIELNIDDRFLNNARHLAQPLVPGGHQHLLVSSEMPDWFEFDVPEGAFLFVELEVVDGDDEPPRLTLYEGGVVVASGFSTGTDHLISATRGNSAVPMHLEVSLRGVRGDDPIQSVYYTLRVTIAQDCNGDGFPDPNSPAEDCIGVAEDIFEDNDRCEDAIRLAPGRYDHLTSQPGDVDFFRVQAPEGGVVDVNCDFDANRSDLQLALFRLTPSGTPCEGQQLLFADEAPNGRSFTIDQQSLGDLEYLIVVGAPDRPMNYALEILPQDSYSNNQTCATAVSIDPDQLASGTASIVTSADSPDWFEVAVQDGEVLRLDVDDRASIRLFDSCGGREIEAVTSGDALVYIHRGPPATLRFVVELPSSLPILELDLEVTRGDVRSLQVASHSPPNNQGAVHANENIAVDLTRDLEPSSVTRHAFQLRGSLTGPFDGEFSIADARGFSFNPRRRYLPGEVLTFSATSEYLSRQLDVLDPPYLFQFTAATGPASGVLRAPQPNTAANLGGNRSYGVKLADFDRDGDLDAVVINFDDNSTLWRNDGGVLVEYSHIEVSPLQGRSARGLAVGDVDGDGILDIVISKFVGMGNFVWLGDGRLSFRPHPEQTRFGERGPLSYSEDLELGDLDGDGDLDAVVVSDFDGEGNEDVWLPNTVWLNDGSGVFTAHPEVPSFGLSHSREVSLGDVDNDGDLDAVIANRFDEPQTVWLNDGTGALSAHPSAPTFGAGRSEGLVLGDIDGDNDLDALVVNSRGQGTTVWVNDGNGVFSAHPSVPVFGAVSGFDSMAIALGDLDGDGDLDAAVANDGKPQTVWMNDGHGSFAPHPEKPTFGFERSSDIALGDIDGDRTIDAIVANLSLQPAKVVLNESVGTAFLRGDCNGDGSVDISDPVSNLSYQFIGSFSPDCLDACDYDDSGVLNLTDPIGNLSHLFLGGPPATLPGSLDCGLDPTEDDLGCEDFSACAGG